MLLPECLEKMVRLSEEHPNVAIVGAHGLYSCADLVCIVEVSPIPAVFYRAAVYAAGGFLEKGRLCSEPRLSRSSAEISCREIFKTGKKYALNELGNFWGNGLVGFIRSEINKSY
jgi:hypothetical protein